MIEEQNTNQQITLDGGNLITKVLVRMIDYLFIIVAIRLVAVYFGAVEHGILWVLFPIITIVAAIALIVIALIIGEKVSKYVKRKKEK